MAKPNWNPSLEQVLKRPTVQLNKISEKTKNEYKVDVISNVVLMLAGTPETIDEYTKYPVADVKNGLEYTIKVKGTLIEGINFGQHLTFTNLTGGALSNGNGWYKADGVEKYVKKA